MLTIRCKRLLKTNTLTLNSFTPNLLFLRYSSPINTFSSLDSSDSSKSEANSTLFDKRRDKSEQVISLLKSHGFTETQISKIVHLRPRILFVKPQKTLVPKIEFLRSIGISNADLPRIVLADPTLLFGSLKNKLIPCHKFLKSVLIDDENVVKMLKRSSRILTHDVERVIAPNIGTLIGVGIPKPAICFMLFHFPKLAHEKQAKLKRNVEEVIRMGLEWFDIQLYFIYCLLFGYRMPSIMDMEIFEILNWHSS